MPVEEVYSIAGRGTVVTGRMERDVLINREKVQFVGHNSGTKTVVTCMGEDGNILSKEMCSVDQS